MNSLLFILRRKPKETVASSLSGKKAFGGARPGLAALRVARSGFRLRPIFYLIYKGTGEIHSPQPQPKTKRGLRRNRVRALVK